MYSLVLRLTSEKVFSENSHTTRGRWLNGNQNRDQKPNHIMCEKQLYSWPAKKCGQPRFSFSVRADTGSRQAVTRMQARGGASARGVPRWFWWFLAARGLGSLRPGLRPGCCAVLVCLYVFKCKFCARETSLRQDGETRRQEQEAHATNFFAYNDHTSAHSSNRTTVPRGHPHNTNDVDRLTTSIKLQDVTICGKRKCK